MKRAFFILFSTLSVATAACLVLFTLLRWNGHMSFMRVPTNAMAPFFNQEDQIICEGFSMMSKPPARGSVVTFTTEGLPGILPEGAAPVIFMKRVIGLPGDKLQLVGRTLLINGRPASDFFDCGGIQYVLPLSYPGTRGMDIAHPYVVPEDHVVVFGDNSADSFDSRYWGPLPMKNLRHTYWFHVKRAEVKNIEQGAKAKS